MSCTDFLFYEFLSEPEGQWSCYSQADMGLERKKKKEGLFASQHCFFTVFLFFFFFFDNEGVRASLRAPRLIPRVTIIPY